ncbi:hypothetical protein H0X48_05100 [Candidatus Dependentiae bacterium]|nr:hypothetical protein [Candidatus Dependentiae bacterium]
MKKSFILLTASSLIYSMPSVEPKKPKKLKELTILLKCSSDNSSKMFLFINKDKPRLSDLLQSVSEVAQKPMAQVKLTYLGKNIATPENIKNDILLKELGILPDVVNKVSCVDASLETKNTLRRSA